MLSVPHGWIPAGSLWFGRAGSLWFGRAGSTEPSLQRFDRRHMVDRLTRPCTRPARMRPAWMRFASHAEFQPRE
ncbi:hypothetical protein GCM10010172_77800 [Paractinoplanes ferrugineus]|uniref:Uncharacterized protein n=1 Tax=Paractinoplanes ferrugineus TaxID=113564 RepID=A0A919J4J0_9ACTN|nr:hypothetical protein Afe05nite_46930 [Actinoplanes ferrugineus]